MKNLVSRLWLGALSLTLMVGAGAFMQSCEKYEGGPGISLRSKTARLVNNDQDRHSHWYDPYGLVPEKGPEGLSLLSDGYSPVDINGDGIGDALPFQYYDLIAPCAGGSSKMKFNKDGTCTAMFYSPIGTTLAKDWTGWDADGLSALVALKEFSGRWEFEDDKEALHIHWEILAPGSDWSDPDVVGDPPGAFMDWHCDLHKLTLKEVWMEFNWVNDSYFVVLDGLPTP